MLSKKKNLVIQDSFIIFYLLIKIVEKEMSSKCKQLNNIK